MSGHISIGEPSITVQVRYSAQARRYGLRISHQSGAVILTVPAHGSLEQARDFACAHEGWIRKNLATQPQLIAPDYGQAMPVDGKLVTVRHGSGRSAVLTEQGLLVPGQSHLLAGKLRAFYKLRTRDALVPASHRYAARLDREIGRVTLRDTRSRWGSCTSEGNLMYSWRLAMAPPAVQDYVAAHEVCHLSEMNHGPDFWHLVEEICPDYRLHRNWLRSKGAALHRYKL